MRIVQGTSERRLNEAAEIWAAATAARDGDPSPAPTGLARSRLDEVFAQAPDAFLLVAVDRHGTALSFALTQPAGRDSRTVLRFFAVRPDQWGRGVGAALLRELDRCFRSRQIPSVELWVNRDNPAAIALYRRAGWYADGATRLNERSGRTMMRLTLDLDDRRPAADQ